MCGISAIIDNTAAYIQGWMKALANDPRMVVSAAGHAEKAVGFLMGKSQDNQHDE